jgi:hypothetical protein
MMRTELEDRPPADYDETEARVSKASAIPHDDDALGMPAGGSAAGSAFCYEPPGKGVAFNIAYDVVDRLSAEIMRGFGLVPRRGAEVGGILLGAAEQGERLVVRIDDFIIVPSEHLRGPSYILSDNDLAVFDRELAKLAPAPDRRIQAVGFFRSNTRDQMQLGPEDLSVLDSRFPGSTAVCLLVRPYATRVSEAALLLRGEDGRFAEGEPELVFPFRRRELGGGRPVRKRDAAWAARDAAGEPDAEFAGTAEDSEEQSVEAIASQLGMQSAPTFGGLAPAPDTETVEQEPKAGRGWVWIPLSFIFLLLGVVLGFQIAISFREPAPAVVAQENPYQLGLSIEPSGESLTLRWNVAAPAILAAERGVLIINEANNEKVVELSVDELRRGGVLYRNSSPDVRFRLEAVLDERNSVVESVRTRVVEAAREP